jgi:uncharacterized protein (DUF1778 family)
MTYNLFVWQIAIHDSIGDSAVANIPSSTQGSEQRISLRIPEMIKERIAKAAALEGRSLTDYVTDAANRAAIRTLEAERIIEVDEQNMARISALLASPPKPTAALRRLMARKD